jgi:hypothetical protein
MRLDLDFPRRRVTISVRTTGSLRYPHLAQISPSLPMVLTSIDEGHVAEAVMALAWDIERSADRMLAALSKTGGESWFHGHLPPLPGSRKGFLERVILRDKLLLATGSQSDFSLRRAVQLFTQARNKAAHDSLRTWEGDPHEVLTAAEKIASKLKSSK